jgi:sarcosine oxidase, subunit beta
MRNIAQRLAELFPPLATVPVLRDRLEPPAGFVIATASGHGFGLCPAIGKVVSELVTKGTSSIPVERLALGRFAGLEPSWRQGRRWDASAYNT